MPWRCHALVRHASRGSSKGAMPHPPTMRQYVIAARRHAVPCPCQVPTRPAMPTGTPELACSGIAAPAVAWQGLACTACLLNRRQPPRPPHAARAAPNSLWAVALLAYRVQLVADDVGQQDGLVVPAAQQAPGQGEEQEVSAGRWAGMAAAAAAGGGRAARACRGSAALFRIAAACMAGATSVRRAGQAELGPRCGSLGASPALHRFAITPSALPEHARSPAHLLNSSTSSFLLWTRPAFRMSAGVVAPKLDRRLRRGVRMPRGLAKKGCCEGLSAPALAMVPSSGLPRCRGCKNWGGWD